MYININFDIMSPFLIAQDSSWYEEFLAQVVHSIITDSNCKSILDIGTGPGKLPEMLIKRDETRQITGIDISSSMIEAARKRLTHKHVQFLIQDADAPLAFSDNTFDVVTFCSVLFHLDDATKTRLMSEALRILKPTGKILVLTPTGQKTFVSAFVELPTFRTSKKNWTYFVWKLFTSPRGSKWQQEQWLKHYSDENQLKYSKSLVFNNNATIEEIQKTTK